MQEEISHGNVSFVENGGFFKDKKPNKELL
jgi:hypothetical protein